MTDNIKAIQDLENKYGILLFRMALTYLVDVGVHNLSEEDAEETIKQIIAKNEKDKANSGFLILAVDFQCKIIRCATELAKCSIWDLFYYIKYYVHIEKL